MLGSGSAGNSALVATDHCKILVDGGLSARQAVLRLEQCGLTPEQLDGVVVTHEHTDHICGLEVLCHKFELPIYCNRLTAEALRSTGLANRCRNWRSRTLAERLSDLRRHACATGEGQGDPIEVAPCRNAP